MFTSGNSFAAGYDASLRGARRIGRVLICIALALTGLSLSAPTWADTRGTLERIKARGAVVLGHRESSVPFSYVGRDSLVHGYSHELALRVVDAIRKHLGDPLLVLRLVQVTPQDRISRIRSGEVDLECGSTTHNSMRARQVGFSNTIFIIGTRLLTRRDSRIHDFPDLSGKRVVTTADTTSDHLLRRMNHEQLMDIDIVTTPDHHESFLLLERGEADAFMMDDALLYGELAKAWQPDEWVVTGAPRSFEAYACMLGHGDPDFKRLIDRTLAGIMTSGEAEAIYQRWFMNPLPDSGLNLNFPLSDAMRTLYRSPNDRPFQ